MVELHRLTHAVQFLLDRLVHGGDLELIAFNCG